MIYSPEEDSYLLEEQIRKYAKGKKFLDLGAGSGIQSLAAIKSGAKEVLAVDIDEESIRELKIKGLNAKKSNLFSKVNGEFDLIAFNPPYLPLDEREDKESRRITTGGKRGDELILRFLKQVPKHLSPKGKILLLISSLTPEDRIINQLKKQNLNFKIVSRKKIFMEELRVLEIKF